MSRFKFRGSYDTSAKKKMSTQFFFRKWNTGGRRQHGQQSVLSRRWVAYIEIVDPQIILLRKTRLKTNPVVNMSIWRPHPLYRSDSKTRALIYEKRSAAPRLLPSTKVHEQNGTNRPCQGEATTTTRSESKTSAVTEDTAVDTCTAQRVQ